MVELGRPISSEECPKGLTDIYKYVDGGSKNNGVIRTVRFLVYTAGDLVTLWLSQIIWIPLEKYGFAGKDHTVRIEYERSYSGPWAVVSAIKDPSPQPVPSIPPPPPPDKPIRIAVWRLTPMMGVNAEAMKPVTDSLRDTLLKTNRFNILARDEMAKIIKEQNGSLATACDSTDCAVEYGQNLSVEKIVVGNAAKVGSMYQIVLKMINVETGTVERTGKARGTGGEEVLFDLVDEAAKSLLE